MNQMRKRSCSVLPLNIFTNVLQKEISFVTPIVCLDTAHQDVNREKRDRDYAVTKGDVENGGRRDLATLCYLR